MNIRHRLLRAAGMCGLFFMLLSPAGHSQGIDTLENTDLFIINPLGVEWGTGVTRVDSVWLGAAFLRDTSKTFRVWVAPGNSAGWTGDLYLFVPHGANNGGDTSIYLFHNQNNGANPTNIDLTNNPVVRAHIQFLDTIYFRYTATPNGVVNTGYSGPNRSPADVPAWHNTDYIWSNDRNTRMLYTLRGPPPLVQNIPLDSFMVGRRWCSAGWIRNSITNTRTDTVQFAFEDNHSLPGNGFASDFDFNDVLFKVTGVFLMFPTPNKINIRVWPSDTIMAGDTATIVGQLIDEAGRLVPFMSDSIRWTQDPFNARPGDRVIIPQNDTTKFTGTVAYRRVLIIGAYRGPSATVLDTVWIYIKPNIPDHLVIEQSSSPLTVSPNADNPLGGPAKTITLGPTQTADTGWAVLRDRFQNYVSFSNPTTWGSTQTAIITAANGNQAIGEGVMTKVGPAGTSRVGATNTTSGIKTDSITVIVSNTTYDSLRIMRYDIATGQLVRINSLTVARGDSATLYVQGLRSDRLGPNGGWETVQGNWSISANLETTRIPPQNSNSWVVAPINTGTGIIAVNLTSGPGTSIPVTFLPGTPNSIAIYPARGAPSASNTPWVPEPRVADTVIAGVAYTKLYAKVFDGPYWLQQYEDSLRYYQQIQWSVTPLDETTLSQANNYFTTLTTTRAYRAVRVTASLPSLNLSYSILLWVKAGPVHHIVIEASANIQDYVNDQPLSQLIIPADQVTGSVYAILRDTFGNFVDYSKVTAWSSTNTALFTADTGLTSVGEGIAFRRADSGTALMIAFNSTYNLRDSVPVVLNNIYYKSLRIYIMDNGPKYVDTIRIATDGSLMLYVEGERSDGRGWDNVPAAWAISALLKTRTPPPNWLDRWDVIPDSIGSGWIRAARPDAGSDSVYAIFLPGRPNAMTLYRRVGTPSPALLFPAIDTIAAGSTDTLVAKIFDRNGQWLSQYENIAVSRTLISWTIQKLDGPIGGGSDTLTVRAGHLATFTPAIAYTRYQVTATFVENGVTLTAGAQIYVKPGPPHHLVIEPTANITGTLLLRDNPVDTIVFGARDTVKSAFAILRDRYGNFVGYSTNTSWPSLNALIVTAAQGTAAVGEGRITRVGTLGTTQVGAVNVVNSSWKDSVVVVLSNFAFDSLRIVVRDTAHIQSLTMRSDQDTALQVLGKRSFDGVWVPVNGNWSYFGRLDSSGATNLHEWRFVPGDTGTGKIIVSMGSGTVPDTITVIIKPGLPAKLVLYPTEGPPVGMQPLPDPSQMIGVIAGVAYKMVAKVFDHRGVYLADFEQLSQYNLLISWSAANRRGTNLSGQLAVPNGAVDRFTPTRAYDSVFVIARLDYDPTHRFADTVQLEVKPGPGMRIVLEKSPNYDRWVANPCDTLVIAGNQQSGSVYAIVRDAYGNFVSYADVRLWGSLDTATVGVRSGNTNIGEGVALRKVQTDTTKIYGVDAGNFKDTCVVALLAYSYTRLRIIAGKDTIPMQHAVLVMNTNQDTTLRVQGMRSDTTLWEDVNAAWQNSTNLSIIPAAPGSDKQWRFSPSDTGTGWIKVSYPGATGDSLPVRFTPGGAIRVEIEILTPPDRRIAGEPITAVVRIYDADNNLVRGSLTADTAAYHDTLGRGGLLRPRPYLLLGSDTVWLDATPWDAGGQTFVSGLDTVTFTLFHAPYNTNNGRDSLHQIFVGLRLGGLTLRDSSDQFVLHPGPLNSIAIEYPNGTRVRDTVLLNYPQGSINAVSFGYDRYGNRIDPVPSDWSTNGTLHPVTPPSVNVPSIFFGSSTVTQSESGYLIVVKDTLGTIMTDTIYIVIRGPGIRLLEAITGDVSGNGYLDRITLVFSRRVNLPGDSTFKNISIKRDTVTFVVDSILNNTGRSDSVWVLSLRERRLGQPQTSWTPVVYLPAQAGLDVEEARITATDGAGPVVWTAVKQLVLSKESADRSRDRVTITFSEPVKLNPSYSAWNPSLMFAVWTGDPAHPGDTTRFVPVPGMLTGITNQDARSDAQRSIFLMSNGNDLTSRHWVNFDSVTRYVMDLSSKQNRPNDNNQKVRVIVTGDTTGPAIPIPNPMRPSVVYVTPGTFELADNRNAVNWARDHGGTAIVFDVIMPPVSNVDIHCLMKIYDAVGNVVQSAENKNFRPDSTSTSNIRQAAVYWNGTNAQGMVVAAGVYRVVVYIRYVKKGTVNADIPSNQKKIALIGVVR